MTTIDNLRKLKLQLQRQLKEGSSEDRSEWVEIGSNCPTRAFGSGYSSLLISWPVGGWPAGLQSKDQSGAFPQLEKLMTD
jgi:hypothetical protein